MTTRPSNSPEPPLELDVPLSRLTPRVGGGYVRQHYFMRIMIPFTLLTLLLAGCGRHNVKIQQQVTGTWVVHYGGDIRCTNIIAPDGGYSAAVTGFPDGHSINIEGTILAKGGDLIETITSDSETNQQVPIVVRGHIITLDDHQMVMTWDAKQPTITVAQKVE